MRQITREAINAFNNNETFSKSNTMVRVDGDTVRMLLHGNMIAKKVKGDLFVTDAGWSSNTTKERLNGLQGVSIVQKNFIWYLNGQEWDGSLTKVN